MILFISPDCVNILYYYIILLYYYIKINKICKFLNMLNDFLGQCEARAIKEIVIIYV